MGRDEVRIHIEAPPERVWSLIADVTRMGEWSPICRRCEWIDGATGPAVGARFVGHNRQGPARWSRECVVTACEPGREFAFSTVQGGRPQTNWRYRLEPSGTGTEIVESFEGIWEPRWVRAAKGLPGVRARSERDTRRGMEATLARIKAAAERH